MGVCQKGVDQNFIEQKIIYNEIPFLIEDQRQLQSVQNRGIGGLRFLNKQMKIGAGTGVLISKDLVLTAAHNIYDKQQNCEYTELKFFVGGNGPTTCFSEAKSWRYPQQFKSCPNDIKRLEFDYALIKLKKPVDFQQFPLLTVACEKCLMYRNKELNLQIYGYPFHEQNYLPVDSFGDTITLHQYGLARKGRILEMQQFKLNYAISTLPGHSGSPIFVKDNIIGIHNGAGAKDNMFNIGRLMTFQAIDKLKNWQRQLNGDQIQIKDKQLCFHLQDQKFIFQSKKPNKISGEIKDLLKRTIAETILQIKQKLLIAIDVTKHYNLQELNLQNNKLQTIDIRQNKQLLKLNLSYNQIKTINLSNNTQLTSLSIQYNQLTEINLDSNKNLENLNLSHNQLVAIDLTKNINLWFLFISYNQLSYLSLRQNTKIRILVASQNRLARIICCYPELKLFSSRRIYVADQNSAQCQVLMIHTRSTEEECRLQMERQLGGYNEASKYNCIYKLSMQKFE